MWTTLSTCLRYDTLLPLMHWHHLPHGLCVRAHAALTSELLIYGFLAIQKLNASPSQLHGKSNA